jgi:cytochrome d ubiquinol oxidase subunit I
VPRRALAWWWILGTRPIGFGREGTSVSDLLAARSQMAMSLAFHIIFAVAGMAMPLLMVMAEGRWLRTGEPVYLELAKRWCKGTAILFAVGAVSGTVLSFELGLLWPHFMAFAGPIVGMPFSLEGFAFFLEGIFLGVYLYGWDRVPARLHRAAGVVVCVAGTISGVFVVCANAWMNAPAGYELDAAGRLSAVHVWRAMFNRAAFSESLHMVLAAYAALGLAVAGIHAARLRHQPNNAFHRKALGIALWVGGVAAVVQPFSGDLSAKQVAVLQPVKLAAMEGQWQTQRGAPLRLGGWPDEADHTTRGAIEIPGGLSFLAYDDVNAEVRGLDDFAEDLRPPVPIVHVAFQIMVLCGTAMAGVALLAGLLAWRRRRLPDSRWFLRLVTLAAPLGLIAVEAGWTVTEVGRQPWVIQGVLRTSAAVTPMPGLIVPLLAFTTLYAFLGVVVAVLLRRQVFQSPSWPEGADSPTEA